MYINGSTLGTISNKDGYFILEGNKLEGERKEFLLNGFRADENTEVSVLGHNEKVIEYRPKADAEVYWDNTSHGLMVSAARGQRLYNNRQWLNPVVFKIKDF